MNVTSSLTSSVTAWRNPQDTQKHLPSLKKIVISEIAYAAIGIAAAVETVANSAFLLFSLPFLLIDSKAAQLPIARLKSSAFTVAWSTYNLVANFGVSNLTVKEETARNNAYKTQQWFVQKFA